MSNLDSKPWTEEERAFVARNVFKLTDEELMNHIGRSMNAIRKQLQTMTKNGKIAKYNRHYTKMEDDILLDNHGTVSMERLQMMVFRTEHSIRSRLYRLTGECKANTVSGDYKVSEVATILGYTVCYVRKLIKKTDIPFKSDTGVLLVDFDEFWKWIKDNDKYINASSIDHEELYHCPEWYVELVNKKKRELSNSKVKKGTWTMHEVSVAKHLKNKGLTMEQIANELNRNWRSVKEMFSRMRKNETYS